jgi:hypothetical protein
MAARPLFNFISFVYFPKESILNFHRDEKAFSFYNFLFFISVFYGANLSAAGRYFDKKGELHALSR